jgi:enterochelin esterase-like enzyme
MNRTMKFGAALGRLFVTLGLATAVAREEVLGTFGTGELLPREVRVHLPPGSISADTPVLVALDGQMMGAWRLSEALTEMGRTGGPVPLVVAIPATAERIEEYGLAGAPDYLGRGRKAAAFQRMVLEEVLPALRRRHGVALARERTGVFGASMGGLCAFDLAWRHPEVFGFAGVFSGSLWWRGDNRDVAARQSSRLAHRQVRGTERPPSVRFWFEAGTADETDDRDGNGVIDAIQDTTELLDELRARGWRDGPDLAYVQVEGGQHNEATWARALPLFLNWALPEREKD